MRSVFISSIVFLILGCGSKGALYQTPVVPEAENHQDVTPSKKAVIQEHK